MSSSFSVESGFEKIDRAQAGGAHGHFDVGLAGDHDYGNGGALCAQIFEQRETVFAGHHDVGEDYVETLRLDEFEGAGGAIADGGLVTGEAEGTGEGGQRVVVVVDYQQMSQSLL